MRLSHRDLGLMAYAPAFAIQQQTLESVLASRESEEPLAGVILTVEHLPVITVSRRAGAEQHIVASAHALAAMGIDVAETDRGGDVTYHGPGQLVVYPILDLNAFNLGLHAYMRLLEQAVIDTCAELGVPATRDPAATGVWVATDLATGRLSDRPDAALAKVCAMGVRVRRWISMHGIAINVRTDLSHFAAIVPCGLHGRPVCSLQSLLGENSPDLPAVRSTLIRNLTAALAHRYQAVQDERAQRA